MEDEGRTSLGIWIWSGGILMDLDRDQALKMSVETNGGREYLFVEAGGFSARNGPDWRPPLWGLQRSGN